MFNYSFQHDVDPLDYTKNQAGFHHSHKYGFGLMDSWRLVNLAKVSIAKPRPAGGSFLFGTPITRIFFLLLRYGRQFHG